MFSEPHLAVRIEHTIGTLDHAVDFETSAAWTVLFGASGSGKSTILRAVAGLLRPASGSIAVAGRPVFGSARKIWIPAYARPVRWSGQRATLFPHLSVEQNLAFAAASVSGFSRARRKAAVTETLTHFRLQAFRADRPAQLSGGEQQRVAIARAALAARGNLLLLDEPFTGLDAVVRDQLISDLRDFLGPTPVLSVSHSIAEALILKAHVLRLENGRITAQGGAAQVLAPEIARLRATLDTARPTKTEDRLPPSTEEAALNPARV